MKIRHACEEDIEALAAIEQQCFPPLQAAGFKEIQQRVSVYGDHFFLLEKEGKIVSFVDGMCTDEKDLSDLMYERADMHDPEGSWQMIFGVNTIPSHRGRGYAGRLIRQAICDARSQGRAGLVLTCKDALVHYYGKFGFVDEGISEYSTHGNVVWHQMRLTFRKALVLFPCDGPTRAAAVHSPSKMPRGAGKTTTLPWGRPTSSLASPETRTFSTAKTWS